VATSFRDGEGRTWSVRITIGLLPKLREAGFAVGDLKGADGWEGLADPERLGRVLWVLVGEQAEKAGLTPEAFADGIDGPAIYAAHDAIMGAVADFTRPPAVAQAIKTRLPAVRAKAETTLAARLAAEPIPDLDETPSPSNASAGSSPPSPASTPAPSPSAS
jgi:hypothetical protein